METTTTTTTAPAPIKRKSSNPLGRPTGTYSRRRFAEAVKAMKQILKNERNPVNTRIRATELLCMIYGVFPPESRRDALSVKQLVQEHSFEKQLNLQLDKRLAEQDAERLLQDQAERQAAEDEFQRRTFAAVLEI